MDNTLTQTKCERLAFSRSFLSKNSGKCAVFNVLVLSIESTDSRREIKVDHVFLLNIHF